MSVAGVRVVEFGTIQADMKTADPWQDHYRALQACIIGPPVEWRRRTGRPRQTWLRTVKTDLRPIEPWPGVSQAMCAGQSGMATTRDNGYVHDKLLKKMKYMYDNL